MEAKKIAEGVDRRIRPQVEVLANQILFMADKLEESREHLKDQDLVIDYDNGGGQSGIRENPEFVAYHKLLTSFNKSMTQLREIIGNGSADVVEDLNALRSRFKVM